MKSGLYIGSALALTAAVVALGGRTPAKRIYHHLMSGNSSAASAAPPSNIDPATIRPMGVGMNLTLLGYWSEEDPYVDPIHSHAELKVGGPGGADLVDQFPVSSGGWPQNVPKGTEFTVFIGDSRTLTKGARCKVSPGWTVQTGTNAIVDQNGSHWSFRDQVAKGGVYITVLPQQDRASLAELSCHPNDMPADQLFRPAFLHDVSPFKVLRFMNSMKANFVLPTSWDKRPTPTDISIVHSGISVEHMVELSNLNHSDPWFCLPFDADPDYIRRFAAYVHDHLDADRTAYVELSNEVWNSQFPQGKRAAALGKTAYPSEQEGKAGDFVYADRVRSVMAIWTQVFVDKPSKLVRILGSQAAWADRSEELLSHKETWRSVDAVAIAPYFGVAVPAVSGSGPARIDTILKGGPGYVDTAIGWAKANKAVANKYHLRLVAYEGGPGFEAYTPQDNADLQALQHDERFYGLYALFLDRWRKEIGDLFVAYDSVGSGYGHLDRTGAPWETSPKMRAVADYAKRVSPKPGS